TALTNVKLNFAIGDGSSSSTKFGVVYSTDGGNTWKILDDYQAGSHWNTYTDATYTLDADNKETLTVRMLIQSATKTSNYNLKYLNILADDSQAPSLISVIPSDGAANVLPTGKATFIFNESVAIKGNAAGKLTNNATKAVTQLAPSVSNNKVTYAFDGLDLTTSYTLGIEAGAFSDLSGNLLETPVSTTFTTADRRPVPPPVLDSKDRLWYNRPAAYWEEALPLGNGRLGAMVSGSVACDTLQLNEDTFWGQSPNCNHNPKARGVLDRVRELIFSKDYGTAQKLAIPNWMSEGSHGAQYQSAGCVLIGFPGHRYNDEENGAEEIATDAEVYVRDLDMKRAVATTTYE
ncbi:MAG: glycoside hydrolase N-terminal domain-containing protein, partial [Duncaniella sp.]|nr:glycoside hydrolase N-terminal domain-containing protein [Duncaniella sp.]